MRTATLWIAGHLCEKYRLHLVKSCRIIQETNIYGSRRGKTSCADPDGGGTGSGPPLENYKNIGFLSNTGPDPLKITKLSSQHSMFGHHRPASETPFKWHFAGGQLMARYNGIWILPTLIKLKKTHQSGVPSDKTFWIRAWT